MNSASLYSLAGRYDNPIPPRFLAPIDCLKIQALLSCFLHGGCQEIFEKTSNLGKTSSQVGLEVFVVAIRDVVIGLATTSHVA
jgi:hypothetical protein